MDIENNKAYEFWEKEMGDKKHYIHCTAVIKSCIGMINNTDLNQEIFIISGWIHDIGKINNKDNHHIESIKFLDKFLEKNKIFEEYKYEIEDCILNHRAGSIPKTIYGKIFQIADKVALYDLNWIKYKENIKK